ncbi:PolC-type DNA polymerase III [Lachnospiraceae bacterium]|jgi:DNA polymerase-3 subunit alpha (Gram-positive type)|nr:PolC-type DNA polymerase III [Lachnospiraceae bacterium]GFI16554.1 DNA polymerase III PolC-type [Lachnospiraceae bacterium]
MAKQFFDVFPTLKLDKKMQNLFEQVLVEKVSATKGRDFIRVTVTCEYLIPKETVFRVEKEIKKQFFATHNVTVKLYERFRLSEQYTPRKLMDLYKESILLELRDHSPIEYSIFKGAVIDFPKEDELKLTIEDTVLARSKAAELSRILEKIFNERCGFSIACQMEYEEKEEGRLREEDDEKIARQIAQIAARAKGAGGGEGAYGQGSGETVLGVGVPGAVERNSGNAPQKDKKALSAPDLGKGQPDRTGQGSVTPFPGEKKGLRKGDFGKGGKGDFRRAVRRSDNPDVLYGRDFDEEASPIEDIIGEIGEVVIRGKIISFDTREIKNERTILMFDVTDFTDTMTIKMFAHNEQVAEIKEGIRPGAFVKIKGITTIDRFDNELTIGSLTGVKKIPDFTSSRSDNSARKRVELHCHTKMSDMDGVSEAKDIVKCAYKWGHPAIAITDHGVVQAFPDANHVWEDLWKAEKARRKEAGDASPDKQDFFKIIYGMEAYLVDDLQEIVTGERGQDFSAEFVVFDIETTGFSPVNNRIIEIGAVKVSGGEISDRFSSFVNPDVPIPFEIEKLTGINDSMVMGAPFIEEVLPEFLAFCKDAVLVAHNANFDMSFIKENALRQNIRRQFTYVDTVGIARILLPHQAKHTLDAVAKTMGVSLENHHRAVDDAEATAEIFVKFISLLKEAGADTLAKVNAMGDSSPDIIKRLPSYHAIILAENNLGRENLYRLVSESHLTYYSKRPRVPKSFLMKHREGLILGSACEAGELYRAILDGKPESEVARIVSFYDYLEIQPLGNNKFMIESERIPSINSMEDIMNINRRIVALGEEFNKPVVATCDVHFLNPEDEVYRRIIMSGKGFADADNQAPLYLRTTEEMLEEFAYLGSDKAEEVVITNTNRIADRIDVMAPVRPDKCPPVIPDSDKTLTDICYNRAHELYGEELPKIVKDRLEKELHSIITNGFAVMYIIAQKLVWKSVEDGYLVGSRGSVGSSLVAFMAGITEVNSLSAHYRCSNCFYYDFDSPEVKAFAGNAGCDMPDKNCPVCGKPLVKDGFDIPFETFLGFKGDKEPDIDLNFSGEYQSKAHKYTEVIFGSGQTYRAGTIATLADKTAFGYVKNYYEERGSRKRTCEINRIVGGCTGIRRSTGQHPGGIIVLPMGEDINSFTPVQHPANDMTTDIVTTHFDYHSIDHNLLKLDILGHDDPTMIRMLQDLTGIDPTQIPLDDPKVMSLFQNTSALGITPEQIDGCPVGSMGIPEFGTEFVIQMLLDTKPQCLSDLIRISGLGHGTDVWLGNAQTLILEGTATISSAICCRDDIMIYLINQGVDSALSFTIMESVRKGKGLKPEWEAAMKEKDVPDWYIWSCKKIKYMFPKAHAAAYVMMAWRIAYCKINYPLAYYAAFFSIRASAFSYEIMCQGQKHLESVMADYKRRSDTLSKKEQDSFKDMKIVQEMYARGYEFVPIDIFSAHSRNFQIVDGKLMPSLNSIDGLGERAADAIVEAAKDGAFLSKDDFRQRTKVSKTVIDLMDSLNLLGDLPESNQISLFDFVS